MGYHSVNQITIFNKSSFIDSSIETAHKSHEKSSSNKVETDGYKRLSIFSSCLIQ